MPYFNARRPVAALLGFILLTGCVGVADQPEPEVGQTHAEAQKQLENEYELTEAEIRQQLIENDDSETERQIDEYEKQQLAEEENPAMAPDMVPAERARLISVTDGDTVKVGLADGSRANVRVIGIDTPETYPVIECGGPEATANMRHMVRPGDIVNLYIDPTQDEVDRYGRLLRYVFTVDNVDVGLDQIGAGHASVFVYNNNPFVALDAYQDAEDDARSNNGGIWDAC